MKTEMLSTRIDHDTKLAIPDVVEVGHVITSLQQRPVKRRIITHGYNRENRAQAMR